MKMRVMGAGRKVAALFALGGGETGLARQADQGFQAAHVGAVQGDVAAVAAGDVAGDGEAQAHALGVLVAAFVQAREGGEGFLV